MPEVAAPPDLQMKVKPFLGPYFTGGTYYGVLFAGKLQGSKWRMSRSRAEELMEMLQEAYDLGRAHGAM